MLHAKLRNKPTTKLKKELAAKLKESSLIELELASEAKPRNEPTTELL